MRFADRVVVITGAASGIGLATSARVAREGARVVAVDRDLARLQAPMSSLEGTGHLGRACDLTSEFAVTELAAELQEKVGEVHGLVHCAGIHWLRPLQLTDSGALNEMLTSHVVSSVAVTRALILRRLAAKSGCSVVWLSSAAALSGSAGTTAYAAAKGALVSAARVAAIELARRKVRVNVIAPGVVRTPQSAAFLANLTPGQVQAIEADHLLGIGEPEDVAGVVAFLLSDDARWITGTTLVVDGGLTAH